MTAITPVASQLTPTEYIWRNGAMIRWDDANVHILTHSMQYGSAVFEGIRCYATPQGPAIFRLEEHLRRLVVSCRTYRMDLPFTTDELTAACCEIVERNSLTSCYIRPMVIRGYGASSMVPFASPVEVYLPCWPWGTYLGAGALEQGVDACVSSWHRVAPNTIPAGAKIAGNYLSGQLVKMEALANGFAEGISLTTEGMIGEGSGQNIFLVRNGTLHTPNINGTILPGITRDTVMTLARDLGIPVREEGMPREMLYAVDEIFLCGTASEVTPVRSVDRIPVGDGKPGPVTMMIQQRYLDIANGRTEDTHRWLTHVRAERAASASRA